MGSKLFFEAVYILGPRKTATELSSPFVSRSNRRITQGRGPRFLRPRLINWCLIFHVHVNEGPTTPPLYLVKILYFAVPQSHRGIHTNAQDLTPLSDVSPSNFSRVCYGHHGSLREQGSFLSPFWGGPAGSNFHRKIFNPRKVLKTVKKET